MEAHQNPERPVMSITSVGTEYCYASACMEGMGAWTLSEDKASELDLFRFSY